jgi:MtN3 and saliva related transmembrane protein
LSKGDKKMTFYDILGYAAGSISMLSFVPQVYKTWKIKSAKDVSIQMFILYTTSTFLWIIYGFHSNQKPIYVLNTVVLFLSITQVILKIKYDLRDKKAQKLKDNNEKIRTV